MNKRIPPLLFLLLCCICVTAQQRSENEATDIARAFFDSQKAATGTLKIVPQANVRKAMQKNGARKAKAQNGAGSCYFVNDEDNERFVIVSADERMYEVLGYSDNGVFDANNAPEGLLDLISSYDDEFEALTKGEVEALKHVKQTSFPNISPLIKTQWSQGSPYNGFCPIDPKYNQRSVTGCVATAMAQVMNYWKWPKEGHGEVSYKTRSRGIEQKMGFNGIQFDWNNMANNYQGKYSNAQKKAVATLMHVCGNAILMDYGCGEAGGSSAYPMDMAYALIHYFDYNPNIKYFERTYFSTEDWEKIIIDNLDKKMPVLYSSKNDATGSGHTFVIDGCNSNGYFHINMGWQGTDDGYYKINAINTPQRKYRYNSLHKMICYVSKDSTDNYEDGLFAEQQLITDGWVSNPCKVSINSTRWINAYHNSYNSCGYYPEQKYKGKICIGLYDLDFNPITTLAQRDINYSGDYYYSYTSSFHLDSSIFTEGSQYYIAAYSTADGGETRSPIRTTNGATDYYLAKVQNGKVTFTPRGVPGNPKPSIGTYNAIALDENGDEQEWTVTVAQDVSDTTKYWLFGIDPKGSESGIRNTQNCVYGMIDKYGILTVPTGQKLGDNCLFNKYSAADSVRIQVSLSDSLLITEDVWGCITADTQQKLTQYKATRMTYQQPDNSKVEAPLILLDDEGIVTITCPTKSADIFYTLDGTSPSMSSSFYTQPVQLTENSTIKAIAVKNGKMSEEATETADCFKVETPVITDDNGIITITCSTPSSVIYYTINGDQPGTGTGTRYTGSLNCKATALIKAIAVKSNWNDSEMAECLHVNDVLEVAVDNAEELLNKIGASRYKIKSLKVTGPINGTDVALIRDMTLNGILAHIDLSDATIVSGGVNYYYVNYYKSYYTSDNVVGMYMFADEQHPNDNLRSIVLPSNMVKFEGMTNCTKLKTLDIPEGCEYIGAITHCPSLETMSFPQTANEIKGAGEGCTAFAAYTAPYNPYSYYDYEGVLYKEEYIDRWESKFVIVRYPVAGKKVYEIPFGTDYIAKDAFSYTDIDSIYVDWVEEFGEGAFSNCKNLKYVYLNPKITCIPDRAFEGCTSLKSLAIPSRTTSISPTAFNGCTSLQEFSVDYSPIIHEGIIEADPNIGLGGETDYMSNYFINQGVLFSRDGKTLIRFPIAKYAENYVLPDSVDEIADYAFYGAMNLKSFTLPQSLKRIGKHAFDGCTVSSITFPDSLDTIDEYAFTDCSGLTSLVLPKHIKVIGHNAFMNCTSLKYLYLPNSIEELWGANFKNCKALESVNCDIEDPSIIKVRRTEGISHDNEGGGLFDWNWGGGMMDDLGVPYECTWYVPFGCSEAYQAVSEVYNGWFRKSWSLVEKPREADSNGDCQLNADDITEMVGYIINDPSEDFVFEVSDLNKDGEVDVTDISIALPRILTAENPDQEANTAVMDDMEEVVAVEKKNYIYGICLNNRQKYIAVQFDIVITEGEADIENIELNANRGGKHLVNFMQREDKNHYRVIIHSPENEAFGGNEGELLTFRMSNSCKLDIENVYFIDSLRKRCRHEDMPVTDYISYIKGNGRVEGNTYSINGVKMPQNQSMGKGVYIVNGKTTVVK